MGKRIIIVLLIMGGAIISGCSSLPEPAMNVRGAVLPHHLLVKERIENFYKTLENPAIEHIVLISPNHFNYGYGSVRTNDEAFAKEGTAALYEIKDFELEHGITAHEPFIKKHFPNATLTSIIIKIGADQARLGRLIEQISAEDPTHTLVLASIDFTHMDPEESALRNDKRTIDWLEKMKGNSVKLEELRLLAQTINPEPAWDSVAIDSPESLYVLARVMENWGSSQFELRERTSSVSLIPGLDSSQNTSHIFGTFRGN